MRLHWYGGAILNERWKGCHNAIATPVSTEIAARTVLACCSFLLSAQMPKNCPAYVKISFLLQVDSRHSNSSERLASVSDTEHLMLHRTLDDSITTERSHDYA